MFLLNQLQDGITEWTLFYSGIEANEIRRKPNKNVQTSKRKKEKKNGKTEQKINKTEHKNVSSKNVFQLCYDTHQDSHLHYSHTNNLRPSHFASFPLA